MLDIFDKLVLTVRLITTSVLSVGSLIIPDVFDCFIEHNIKKINDMININAEPNNSNRVQEDVQSEESRACDVVEESSGSCSEHDYDKVSTTESDQSEPDEREVSSK